MILLRDPQRGNYNMYVSLFFRTRTYYYYKKKNLYGYAAAVTGLREEATTTTKKIRRPHVLFNSCSSYLPLMQFFFIFSFICKSFWRRPKEFIINSPPIYTVCVRCNINNMYNIMHIDRLPHDYVSFF